MEENKSKEGEHVGPYDHLVMPDLDEIEQRPDLLTPDEDPSAKASFSNSHDRQRDLNDEKPPLNDLFSGPEDYISF